MCDPISAAALAGSAVAAGGSAAAGASSIIPLVALAGSAAAAGLNYAGQQATLRAQQNANNEWLQYQQNASAQALAADTAARQKAQAAEQSTLGAVSPQSQQATQQTAQANLTNQMLAPSNPASANANITALGGGDTANQQVTSDMANRVTQAARAAQGRIAALAGMTSYGGGYGDMGQAAQQAIASGNQAIGLQSDIRGGIAKTLGIAQNVQPVQYQMGSNIAGTIANQLASIAGTAYGSSLRPKAAAPATS